MINRNEALILLKKYLRDGDNIRHSIALEAVLREIAKKLNGNEDLWGLTGLLHNIDYEYTTNEPEKRGILSSMLLEDLLPEDCINAIKANNYIYTDYVPISSLDKSLIASDAATGFIIFTANKMPSKKIAELDLNVLMTKFNDPSFAVKYNRNKIQLCVDIGIDVEAFLELLLNTLKQISSKLNL